MEGSGSAWRILETLNIAPPSCEFASIATHWVAMGFSEARVHSSTMHDGYKMPLRNPAALIIEDEAPVGETLRSLLERLGYEATVVSSATDALASWAARSWALVLLDLSLPDGNGRDVLARVRETGRGTPVIVVSGTTDLRTICSLLRAGADDYLCKPFEVEELSARVLAAARRRGPQLHYSCLGGQVELNPARRAVATDGREVELTPIQFAIVWVLATFPESSVPIGPLSALVLGGESARHIEDCRAHITRTRRRLERLGIGLRIQCTVHDGYALAMRPD